MDIALPILMGGTGVFAVGYFLGFGAKGTPRGEVAGWIMFSGLLFTGIIGFGVLMLPA